MTPEIETKPLEKAVNALVPTACLPFATKAATAAELNVIWTNQRGTPIAFCQIAPSDPEYLPLGDIAFTNNAPILSPANLLFANTPEDPTAFAHPTGFVWILDDKGSGNPDAISYFWPIAPAGYCTLGLAFGSETPNPANYWCVKAQYVQYGESNADYWTDAGSHWKFHNGDLVVPTLPDTAPMTGTAFLVPPTFLSVEQGNPGKVLIVKQPE